MARKLLGRSPLARLRVQAGLSQAAAAAKLGITQQALSRLEIGLNRPNSSTFSKLLRVYRVDANRLLATVDRTALQRAAAA